jgi:putative flippase GtrA
LISHTRIRERRGEGFSIAMLEFKQILRFVVAGTANTILSIIVYQLALFVFGYTASYGIAYLVGILVAFYLYTRHVFRTPMSGARLAAFAAFNALCLVVGGFVNAAAVESLGLSARLAIFVTVAVMVPLNYFGSKWCLRSVGNRRTGEH